MPSDIPQLENISMKEKKLMEDINHFNKVYSCFLHSSANTNDNAKYVSDASCPTPNYTQADVARARQEINKDIDELKTAIRNYTGKNQAQYNRDFNRIISKYEAVMKQRTDLDNKLAELYGTDDGINNFYVNQYRATMFSKIMLTILVTSLVYYTFMKIIKK